LIDIADDPTTYIQTLGELMITVLSMHMTPDALSRAADGARRLADQQEAREASGVTIHPANFSHNPRSARMVAAFYDHARAAGLERLERLGASPPRPGHQHGHADGVATPAG
jgi:hypothetical protein